MSEAAPDASTVPRTPLQGASSDDNVTSQLQSKADMHNVEVNSTKTNAYDTQTSTTSSSSSVSSQIGPTLQSKNRIGTARASGYIYCSNCGENIPINEWPDHRDRLRKVKLAHKMSWFQEHIIRLISEFLMWVLRSVYFREATVVGAENIPRTGAVVFYGNHQNQFIDALMISSYCGRPVRFIMAKKSFRQPVIGTFGRMFNSVPVIRPQDIERVKGDGTLTRMDGKIIYGENSNFTHALSAGDVIHWTGPTQKVKSTAQVERIISDTKLEVTMPILMGNVISEPTTYEYAKRIDHSEMYAEVYDTLQHNHCIGIFPEGGSHDRTSLLPLKAGVALFSLGAAERNISVKIVPCGLTYFYGHKFRSRAYIEFGEAISPPADLVRLFSTDKRKATGLFLDQLNEALRAVTINVPDWPTLNFLHAFRKLYQPPNCTLHARDYLRLTRRLGVVIEQQKENHEFIEFRDKVENYTDYCNALLVRDSQAATLKRLLYSGNSTNQIRLLLRRAFTLYIMAVILVPFFVIAVPLGCCIEYLAAKETRKALYSSKVKIVGADVKGSFKVLYGFMIVPPAFLLIGLIGFLVTDMHTALVLLFSLPMATYVSLLILQEAIMELRAALPLFMSIISRHKQFRKLYEKRETLATLARQMVEKYDPQLSAEMQIYTHAGDKNDDLDPQPSLFSLRYNVRRRQASNT